MRASAWSERGERLHVVQPFRGGWRGQLPSGRRARQELERAQEEKDARWTAQLRVHGRWGRMRREATKEQGCEGRGGRREEGGRGGEAREGEGGEGEGGRGHIGFAPSGDHAEELKERSRSFLGRSAPRTEREEERLAQRLQLLGFAAHGGVGVGCGERHGGQPGQQHARRLEKSSRQRLAGVSCVNLLQPVDEGGGHESRRIPFVGELMKLEAVLDEKEQMRPLPLVSPPCAGLELGRRHGGRVRRKRLTHEQVTADQRRQLELLAQLGHKLPREAVQLVRAALRVFVHEGRVGNLLQLGRRAWRREQRREHRVRLGLEILKQRLNRGAEVGTEGGGQLCDAS